MNRKRAICLLGAVFFISTLHGCASQVPLTFTVPAETDLSRFEQLAVIEFDGKGGDQVRSALESALLNARVEGTTFYKLVTREKLDRVIREQDGGTSIRFDERSAPSVGRLLGADALIAGTVFQFDTHDRQSTERREVTSYSLDKKTSTRTVTYYCLERTAHIAGDVKVYDVNTAELTASLPFSDKLVRSDCDASRSGINVGSPAEMLTALTDLSMQEVVRRITPHSVVRKISLQSSDDGGGGKIVTEHLRAGNLYATHGSWRMAIQEWEKARQLNPNSPAAHYNLGVGYEAEGQLDKARQMYVKAAALKPNSNYIQAAASIENKLQDADRLQKQMLRRK